MDACLAVEREVDKVLAKFNSIKDHSDRVIQDLSDYVENIQTEFDHCPSGHELTPQQTIILKQTITKLRDTVQRLAGDHRDLHSSVSKVGKAIDRNFTPDFAACSKPNVFNTVESVKLLDQVICQHFFRNGMLDVAESLCKESGLNMGEGKTEPFSEINKILDSLKMKDLEPALEWVNTKRDSLDSLNSTLEFKLHRLRFITLIQKGIFHQSEAINYARTHFTQFAKKHEKVSEVRGGGQYHKGRFVIG